MDWSKAKTIIMIALLLTIAFLLFIYGGERLKQNTENKDLQQEILKLLESKEIYVEGTLPGKHARMPVLNVKYAELHSEKVDHCIGVQPGLSGEKYKEDAAVKEYTAAFLAQCGMVTDTLVPDALSRKNDRVILRYRNEIHGGYRLEPSSIACTLQDGKVISVEQYWFDALEFGETKRETVSAAEALLEFMGTRSSEEPIRISHVEMVYWVDTEAVGSEALLYDTAFPAWKIVYNDGETYYVEAYAEERSDF